MENLHKERYMNPFTDYGFKRLFGTEVNKQLLIDFLNELIQEQGRILNVQYKKTEQLGRRDLERKAFFDIYCETESGERFIVEMQQIYQTNFEDRSLYYTTFPIQEQACRGDWDYSLNAVYFIGILDFKLLNYRHNDLYRHEIKLVDIDDMKTSKSKLTFIYLEMPKFTKTEDELETLFEKWMFFLKNLHQLQDRPHKLQEKIFDNAFRIAEISQFTDEDMDTYEESLKNLRDWNNALNTAITQAKEEAREEGLSEGCEQGRKEEKLRIAQKLFEAGFPISEITKITELSVEEITESM